MRKTLLAANIVSVFLVLAINYFSQTGAFNDQTIGGLSAEYDNLFTPASYAFAIWGLIFFSFLLLIGYQSIVLIKGGKGGVFSLVGFWFASVNLVNAGWVVVWLYELTGLSVVFMVFMLFGLTILVQKFCRERARLSLLERSFVQFPISLYAGWIAVATIANISAFLSKIGWSGGALAPETWTIAVIFVAVLVYTYVLWVVRDFVFAAVGIWALLAIYQRHSQSVEMVALSALIGAGIILLLMVVFKFFVSTRITLHKRAVE
ncbi:MAG: tryptophan-rich sensory protein [Bacteroidota bacterium]